MGEGRFIRSFVAAQSCCGQGFEFDPADPIGLIVVEGIDAWRAGRAARV